jgi:transglutaminase-like putative cysteine protease
MKKPKTAVTVLCISLLVVAFGVLVFKSPSPQTGYRFPRHIQYGFTLENTSNRAIQNAGLWTYTPVARTATQRCEGIYTSHPSQVVTDTAGNRIIHFTFDLVPPYATKIINIEASLLLSEKPNPCTLDDPGPFLKPEPYCESDHPAIRRLAKALEAPNPLKAAENIFRWVNANITYSGYARNARGALYALKHKNGDCTEIMYLFAALCRADKIPARCVSGYLCKEDGLLKPSTFHNWAEFYQGGSWWISDPQNGVFMKDPSRYIAMRIINGLEDPATPRFDRFQIRGEGLKARMNS